MNPTDDPQSTPAPSSQDSPAPPSAPRPDSTAGAPDTPTTPPPNGDPDPPDLPGARRPFWLAVMLGALALFALVLYLAWPFWPEPTPIAEIDPGPVGSTVPDTMTIPVVQRPESDLPVLSTDTDEWTLEFAPLAWHETRATARVHIVHASGTREPIALSEPSVTLGLGAAPDTVLPTLDPDETTCFDRPLSPDTQSRYCVLVLHWSPPPGQTLNAQLAFQYRLPPPQDDPDAAPSSPRAQHLLLRGHRAPEPPAVTLATDLDAITLTAAPGAAVQQLLRLEITHRPAEVLAIEALHPHPQLALASAQSNECVRAYHPPSDGAPDWCRMRVTWTPQRPEDRLHTQISITWQETQIPQPQRHEHLIALSAGTTTQPPVAAPAAALHATPAALAFGASLPPGEPITRDLTLEATRAPLTVARIAFEPPNEHLALAAHDCLRAYHSRPDGPNDWCTLYLTFTPPARTPVSLDAHHLSIEWAAGTGPGPRRRLDVPLTGDSAPPSVKAGDLHPVPATVEFTLVPFDRTAPGSATERLELHYRPADSTSPAPRAAIERVDLITPLDELSETFTIDHADCDHLIPEDFCVIDLTWQPREALHVDDATLHIVYRPQDRPRDQLLVPVSADVGPRAQPTAPSSEATPTPRLPFAADPGPAFREALRAHLENPSPDSARALLEALATPTPNLDDAQADALRTLLQDGLASDPSFSALAAFLARPTPTTAEALKDRLRRALERHPPDPERLVRPRHVAALIDALLADGTLPALPSVDDTYHVLLDDPADPADQRNLRDQVERLIGDDSSPPATALRAVLDALLSDPHDRNLQSAFERALTEYAAHRGDAPWNEVQTLADDLLRSPDHPETRERLRARIDALLAEDASPSAEHLAKTLEAFLADPTPQSAARLADAIGAHRRAHRGPAGEALTHTLTALVAPSAPTDPDPPQTIQALIQNALDAQKDTHRQQIEDLETRLETALTRLAVPEDDPVSTAPSALTPAQLNAAQLHVLARRALPTLIPGVGRLVRHHSAQERAGAHFIDPDYRPIGIDPAPGTSGRPVPLENVVLAATPIRAVLAHNIDARIPGPITAIVEHDVWSAHGRNLVIPHGSELNGQTLPLDTGLDPTATTLQGAGGRIPFEWHRLTRPDGAAFRATDVLQTADLMGRSRVPADVDLHEIETYVTVLASKVPQALALLAVRPLDIQTIDRIGPDGTLSTITRRQQTPEERAIEKLNEGLHEVGQHLSRHLLPQPSLFIAAGTRIVIFPTEDLRLKPARESSAVAAARLADQARQTLAPTEDPALPTPEGHHQTTPPALPGDQDQESAPPRARDRINLIEDENPWYQEPLDTAPLPAAPAGSFYPSSPADPAALPPVGRTGADPDPPPGSPPTDTGTIEGLLPTP